MKILYSPTTLSFQVKIFIKEKSLSLLGGTSRNGHSKYIWIKKIDAHGKATWEKTVSTSSKPSSFYPII